MGRVGTRWEEDNLDSKRSWIEDIKAAKQLLYPKIVVDLLRKESDPAARQRILHDARMGKYNNK